MEAVEERAYNLQWISLSVENENYYKILFSHLSKMAVHYAQDYRPVPLKSSSDLILTVLSQLHGNRITLLWSSKHAAWHLNTCRIFAKGTASINEFQWCWPGECLAKCKAKLESLDTDHQKNLAGDNAFKPQILQVN